MQQRRPRAIVFDDAHVAEGMMRDAFTVSVDVREQPELYREICALFEDHFTELAQGSKFEKASPGGGEAVMAAPRGMMKRTTPLQSILRRGAERHDKLSFPFTHLEEHLDVCSLVISNGILQIAPPFVPARTLRGFQQDVRRVYLSATLQSQVEFVRAFGRRPDVVIEPDSDAGNGERLILDGRKVDGGFGPEFVRRLARERKAVIAVPSYDAAKRWSGLSTPPKAEKFGRVRQ